ncbi:MAG: hypothetical protein ACR2Q4_11325 [Geminicoccaceae bacterium]
MPAKLNDRDLDRLWHKAHQRLELVDAEPPVSMAEIDQLLTRLGRRAANQSIEDWLKTAAVQSRSIADPVAAVVVPFDSIRHRFTPVVEFIRLAADDGGSAIPLPTGALEDDLGKFRLQVSKAGDDLVVKVTALGHASDDYANCKVGLAAPGSEPVAVLDLDDDGDGEVILPDNDELRRLLLNPVIGLVEER